MSSREKDPARLRHMLDHAREAVAMARGKQRSDLTNARMLQLALVRLVEIVGEAAARVSDETRNANAQIPWKRIAGMRNRLIHGYDMVDLDLVWETVTTDLPALIADLERMVPPASP